MTSVGESDSEQPHPSQGESVEVAQSDGSNFDHSDPLSHEAILGEEASVSIERIERYSGPLPHPALFARYERVQAGFAERIMQMTEKQLEHQIKMDQSELEIRRRVVDAEIRSFTRSQWFTFVLVLVFLILAGISLFLGQELGAIAAGLAALGTIAYALQARRRPAKDEDTELEASDASTDEPS